MIGLEECSLSNSVMFPDISVYSQVAVPETMLNDSSGPVRLACRTPYDMYLNDISHPIGFSLCPRWQIGLHIWSCEAR
jgi:hypothetical protein